MKAFATHRRAKFDYEILDTFEVGIVLSGIETKAVRAGKAKLEGSHVVVRGGEAFLVGAGIAPYQPNNTPKDYDPERPRTLLLTAKELTTLETKSEQKGLTVVPLSLYNKNRKVKLEIAVVRGKKKHDKREAIKKRDIERDIKRTLKDQ